jgi:hypothetical protein
MQLHAKLDLSADEIEKLSQILSCKPASLPDILANHANAALREYVDMYIGQKVFRRGSDILEYRVFLLVQYVFDNAMPDESQISRLFQTTSGESRSLIRAIMSKYQYQINHAVEQSIKNHLEGAKWNDEESLYLIKINNKNIVDALNLALSDMEGSLDQVSKMPGIVSSYRIKRLSYEKLCARYKAKVVQAK